MQEFTVTRLQGKAILPYIEELAQLRIKIFRDYPYLYDGDTDYETKYLNTYASSSNSLLVIVLHDQKVIGASTAIPLQYEVEEIQQPFHAAQLPVKKFFYLGESVLLPEYRGKGIYRQLFAQRESAAREQGYSHATFMAVTRDDDDPRKPVHYTPLDEIWKYFGYTRSSELTTQFSWKELGETEESLKPMHYWVKTL